MKHYEDIITIIIIIITERKTKLGKWGCDDSIPTLNMLMISWTEKYKINKNREKPKIIAKVFPILDVAAQWSDMIWSPKHH